MVKRRRRNRDRNGLGYRGSRREVLEPVDWRASTAPANLGELASLSPCSSWSIAVSLRVWCSPVKGVHGGEWTVPRIESRSCEVRWKVVLRSNQGRTM